ncbi:MAG: PqqD family protein [Deltaproteobacteria bacterium]
MKNKELRYQVNPLVKFHQIHDEVLFLFPKEKHFHALNDSGSWIWTQVRKGKSLPQMVKSFAKRYEISQAEAQRDIQAVIQALIQKKALKPRTR